MKSRHNDISWLVDAADPVISSLTKQALLCHTTNVDNYRLNEKGEYENYLIVSNQDEPKFTINSFIDFIKQTLGYQLKRIGKSEVSWKEYIWIYIDGTWENVDLEYINSKDAEKFPTMSVCGKEVEEHSILIIDRIACEMVRRIKRANKAALAEANDENLDAEDEQDENELAQDVSDRDDEIAQESNERDEEELAEEVASETLRSLSSGNSTPDRQSEGRNSPQPADTKQMLLQMLGVGSAKEVTQPMLDRLLTKYRCQPPANVDDEESDTECKTNIRAESTGIIAAKEAGASEQQAYIEAQRECEEAKRKRRALLHDQIKLVVESEPAKRSRGPAV